MVSQTTAPQRLRRRKAPASGFTLMEVITAAAIIAIVAALAIPTFTQQVRKARRSDAICSMMATAQYLERCFTRYNVYDSDLCADPSGTSAEGYYDIRVERTAATFTVTATPRGDQASDGCGTMTIDELGNRTPTGDGNHCWGES